MLRVLCPALLSSFVFSHPAKGGARDATLDNIIDVDQRPDKPVRKLCSLLSSLLHPQSFLIFQVEIDLTTVPLGSQFAAELFFPDRKNLETGHRWIAVIIKTTKKYMYIVLEFLSIFSQLRPRIRSSKLKRLQRRRRKITRSMLMRLPSDSLPRCTGDRVLRSLVWGEA